MEIRNWKIIDKNLTDLINELKTKLTVSNPKYITATKYSKWEVRKIPEHLYYYWTDNENNLMIPSGVETDLTIKKDLRIDRKTTDYPDIAIELRDLQEEAINEYIKANKTESQNSKGIMVVPTGSGKSILGLALAAKLKAKVLVVVHKIDLVDGWKQDAKLLFNFENKDIGIIQGSNYHIGDQITIGTIQTLSKKQEQFDTLCEEFDMIIVDEAHHAPASSYDITMHFNARHKVALTATDQRNDGLREVMDFYFGGVCFRYVDTIENDTIIPLDKVNIIKREIPNVFYNNHIIVRKNDNTPVKCIFMHSQYIEEPLKYNYKTKLLNIIKNAKFPDEFKVVQTKFPNVRSFTDKDKDFLSLLAKDVKDAVERDKSCLIMVYTVTQCSKIEELLIENGINKSTIQKYNSKNKEVETLKKLAESKEKLVTIATQNIVVEGTNVRAWEYLFLGNSIANEKDLIQAVGRIRRKKEGKNEVFVYDYRFPNVIMINSHGTKRDQFYHNLGFNVLGEEFFGKRVKCISRTNGS